MLSRGPQSFPSGLRNPPRRRGSGSRGRCRRRLRGVPAVPRPIPPHEHSRAPERRRGARGSARPPASSSSSFPRSFSTAASGGVAWPVKAAAAAAGGRFSAPTRTRARRGRARAEGTEPMAAPRRRCAGSGPARPERCSPGPTFPPGRKAPLRARPSPASPGCCVHPVPSPQNSVERREWKNQLRAAAASPGEPPLRGDTPGAAEQRPGPRRGVG